MEFGDELEVAAQHQPCLGAACTLRCSCDRHLAFLCRCGRKVNICFCRSSRVPVLFQQCHMCSLSHWEEGSSPFVKSCRILHEAALAQVKIFLLI